MCLARRGGLRTPSTTDANLDCAFVENALFTPILDFEKSTGYNSVSDQTSKLRLSPPGWESSLL